MRNRTMVTTMFLGLAIGVLSAGCSSGTLEQGFDASLTTQGGCADVLFFAVDPDQSVMLEFQMSGLVAAAHAQQMPTTTSLDLPSPDATLVVKLGARLSSATCVDVVSNGGPAVDRTYAPTSGAATITIRPGASDVDVSKGDLVLKNVVFEAEDGGGSVKLERLEIHDVPVGWFAG